MDKLTNEEKELVIRALSKLGKEAIAITNRAEKAGMTDMAGKGVEMAKRIEQLKTKFL